MTSNLGRVGSTVEPSSEAARVRMQSTRRRDTSPELAIRSLLHRSGLRFRVDVAVILGSRRRADIVFRKAELVVFVDGCFWHGCPEHGTLPKANRDFWSQKLRANQLRDRQTNEQLEEAGWKVMRFWEHEDPGEAAKKVVFEVERRRS